MDHMEERKENAEEWEWYQTYICDFFREELGMDHFSSEQIQRAIGRSLIKKKRRRRIG